MTIAQNKKKKIKIKMESVKNINGIRLKWKKPNSTEFCFTGIS